MRVWSCRCSFRALVVPRAHSGGVAAATGPGPRAATRSTPRTPRRCSGPQREGVPTGARAPRQLLQGSRAPRVGGRGGNAKRADGPAAGSALGSPPCHTRIAPPIPRPFRAHVPIGNFRIRIGSGPKIAHPTSTTRTCLNQTGAGLGLSVLLSCSCRSQQAQKCHNPGRTKKQKLYCRRVSDAFDEAPFGRALCNRP